jgi:hypothetical protein
MNLKLPFGKKDVHYDSLKGEVSLKREKFDELMQFVRDLLEEAQGLENERDTARSRRRRAEGAAQLYAELVEDANRGVEQWLEGNSIQELSRETGIPYATCHRMVRRQLGRAEITMDALGKILRVVAPAGRKKGTLAGETARLKPHKLMERATDRSL